MDIWSVFEYTVMAAVVGLLLGIIKWIFYDKLDARWHYYIWLVLLARLLVPARFEFLRTPLSIFRELPVGKWMERGRILAQRSGYGETASALGRIYLWGVLLLGSFYLAAWLVLRVQIALAPEADGGTREYVERIGAKYGLKSCRHIRICKSSTPYICGLIDPVLVLPKDNIRPEEPVIVHELLHRKYLDVGLNILLRAVRAVNWFNPVIWYLTGLVQNDNEALCDQRVLERCSWCDAKAYGELLIGMGEGKKRNPVKTGTSNLAGSYRNMKTRIRRIRDFGRMPAGIGLAALCITVMLAAAAVGSTEVHRFEAPYPDTAEELERVMLEAQCCHARTPEEAVYLFLLAVKEGHPAYRMAVMPEAERERFGEFAGLWLEKRRDIRAVQGDQAAERYPAYFPRKGNLSGGHSVNNLQTDGERGSAAVYLTDYREHSVTEWKLSLVKEDGWKVWLEEEVQIEEADWQEEPMLCGSARMGDFLVECAWYNEGYFQELAGSTVWSAVPEQTADFPRMFSREYKSQRASLTYLGEEPLEGHQIRVLTGGEEWGEEPDEKRIREYAAMAGADLGEAAEYGSYSFFDSDIGGIRSFDGSELIGGEPVLISGAGVGIYGPKERWKPDDQICMYVRIYIDGVLAEEGEVWSGAR